MADFDVIAERELKVRDEGGERTVRISIGRPYWVEPEREAACPVSIEGVLGRLRDIHGVDTLQALECALSVVRTIAATSEHRKFFWPDGEEYS